MNRLAQYNKDGVLFGTFDRAEFSYDDDDDDDFCDGIKYYFVNPPKTEYNYIPHCDESVLDLIHPPIPPGFTIVEQNGGISRRYRRSRKSRKSIKSKSRKSRKSKRS